MPDLPAELLSHVLPVLGRLSQTELAPIVEDVIPSLADIKLEAQLQDALYKLRRSGFIE